LFYALFGLLALCKGQRSQECEKNTATSPAPPAKPVCSDSSSLVLQTPDDRLDSALDSSLDASSIHTCMHPTSPICARALRLVNPVLLFLRSAPCKRVSRPVRSEVCRGICRRHCSAISEGDFEP